MSVKRVSQNSFKNRTIAYIENGGGISTLINSVVYTDSNYNTLTANAAATTFGTFRILGTNLEPGANVMLANTAAGTFSNVTSNTTYVGSNEIRANVSVTAGNYSLYIFNPDGSAAIYYSGVTFEPYPQWTTTSYSSSAIVNVQLLTSSTAVEQPITYALVSGTLPTGTSLSANGLISGTVTQANSTQSYTFTVSATDIYNETTQSPITLTISLADQYFNQTTLLLNGETATNTYIKDSSNNNFALSPYGSATSNRFSPLWGNGYYGNLFDGSSGYLTSNSSTAFAFGTGNFTIEAWVYLQSYPSSSGSTPFGTTNGSTTGYYFNLGQDINSLRLTSNASGTWTDNLTVASGNGIPLYTWTHVAFVRNGGTLTIYKNGVSVASATGASSYSFTSPSNAGYIGYVSNGISTQYFNGYFSNIRVVGAAVYTTNFTPSTTPLTAIANTVLLTCQSANFTDVGPNAFTLTPNGTVKVVPNQPFANVPTTSTANTNVAGYYSSWFDGSTGYLTAPSNAAFNFGSGAFTIEFWAYISAFPSYNNAVNVFQMGNHTAGGNFLEVGFINSTGTLSFLYNLYNSSYKVQLFTNFSTLNTWTHFAVIFTGTTVYTSINGVLSAGTSYSGSDAPSGQSALIGYELSTPTTYFSGFISNLRVLKGTALYTTNFTPSTTPLTAIANTSLLTLQNSMIVDNSTNAFTLTPTGKVIVSQNQPFASPTVTSNTITPSVYGSGLFDGSTGYITSPTSNTLGSGSWTVEAWVYFTNPSSSYDGVLCTGATGTEQVYMSKADAGSTDGVSQGASINYTANHYQWLHYALVCNGTTMFMYINGILVGSTARTYVPYGTTPVIGRRYADSSSYEMNGYISNVRITPGIAVYTNNFLPSNQPLTPVANTTLLTLQNKNGSNNSTVYDESVNNFYLTRTGTPTQGTFTPFSQTGWSNYWPNSGSLTTAMTSTLAPGTNSFTIECWVYNIAWGAQNPIIQCRLGNGGTSGSWSLYIVSGALYFDQVVTSGTIIQTNSVIPLNAWTHIAVTRDSSNVWRLFVNGVSSGTTTPTNNVNLNYTGANMYIGYNNDATGATMNGYISNLRFVNGNALYTANFTTPTAPLTAVANTALLTCQSNRFLDNSTNAYTITPNSGSAIQVLPFSPFAPGATYSTANNSGSIYFNGSTDYINSAGSSTVIGTVDFTIEFWAYINAAVSSAAVFFDMRASGSAVAPLISTGTSNVLYYYVGSTAQITGPALALNTWYHIAVSRTSGSTKMYLNGVQVGSTYSDSNSYVTQASRPIMGSYGDTVANRFNGYLSNLRVVNQSMYSANFTPPSGPFIPSTNTSLLLLGTNTGIQDATGKNNIINYGTSKTQANTVKFGSGAMYFDGTTGAPLIVPYNVSNFYFGSTNFTIEGWINTTSASIVEGIIGQSTGDGVSTIGWRILLSSGSLIFNYVANGSTSVSVTHQTTLSTNTWYHIAVTRNGTAINVFLNGVICSSPGSYSGTIVGSGSSVYIGYCSSGSSIVPFNGYMDDLRVTNGVARYTSNFTPSSSPDLLQ